jgi:hypothetical protein
MGPRAGLDAVVKGIIPSSCRECATNEHEGYCGLLNGKERVWKECLLLQIRVYPCALINSVS